MNDFFENLGYGLLGIFLIGVIALVFVGPFFSIPFVTSRGTHTGFITAVEKNGVIWKTGRAYVKSDVQSSQEDQYCVMDDAVYNKLVTASQTKEPVTITFVDWLHKGLQRCGGENAIITDVAPRSI